MSTRADIEGLIPPACFGSLEAWARELVAQIVCLRSQLEGKPSAQLAGEVLPGLREARPITEVHSHVLRDLTGGREL